MDSPRLRLIPLVLLVGVPVVVLGAVRLVKEAAGRRASPGELAAESWPDGRPRTTVRSRTEGPASLEERCAFGRDGQEHGCGTLRDGAPWDGTFVDWHSPDPAGPGGAALFSAYRAGRRHGRWLSFHPDGAEHVELVYADDRLVSRRVIGRVGNEQIGEPPAPLPKGTLPLSSQTRSPR